MDMLRASLPKYAFVQFHMSKSRSLRNLPDLGIYYLPRTCNTFVAQKSTMQHWTTEPTGFESKEIFSFFIYTKMFKTWIYPVSHIGGHLCVKLTDLFVSFETAAFFSGICWQDSCSLDKHTPHKSSCNNKQVAYTMAY